MTPISSLRLLLLPLLAALALPSAAAAAKGPVARASYVPGEVVVRYERPPTARRAPPCSARPASAGRARSPRARAC